MNERRLKRVRIAPRSITSKPKRGVASRPSARLPCATSQANCSALLHDINKQLTRARWTATRRRQTDRSAPAVAAAAAALMSSPSNFVAQVCLHELCSMRWFKNLNKVAKDDIGTAAKKFSQSNDHSVAWSISGDRHSLAGSWLSEGGWGGVEWRRTRGLRRKGRVRACLLSEEGANRPTPRYYAVAP